ncbi:MAG: hypothetical protein E6Q97_07540 [Desulfurellales bacterium]|nr:MAG: hypothetical protein E6Q97_07540 [Desulfurellales bacterium]
MMDVFDELSALTPEQQQARMDNARIIAQPFLTDEGRRCLTALRAVTIEQAAWVPGQDASHGYAREGQDSIIRYIEQCIKTAMEG